MDSNNADESLEPSPRTEKVQPWRAFWPIKETTVPSDPQHHSENHDHRGHRPLTWYKSERGQLEDEQRQALSTVIVKKYPDRAWYNTETASVDDIIQLDKQCPYCGKPPGGCTCSTFEGG